MTIDPNELIPNEKGALKPAGSQVTPEPLLSLNELALHHAVNSGGSGQGMSYWANAAKCGRRALLSEQKYSGYRDVQSTLPILKNHFIVGSVYHAMQEGWRREFPDYGHSDMINYVNVNVQEAARLFKGYRQLWQRDLWGDALAIEQQLPATEEAKDTVKRLFGADVTAKVDMVVELKEKNLENARKRLPDLMPGRYIVDFKTAEQPSVGSELAYKMGLQALWYPLVWNLQNPHLTVSGTIFDVIYKRSRRAPRPFTSDDFAAYFAPLHDAEKSTKDLRGMVAQGRFTTREFLGNRAECVSWRGEVCPFFAKECDVGGLA